MLMTSLVVLIFSTGVIHLTCIEAFIDSKGLEPVCPDIKCNNNGTLQKNTCACLCTQGYSGIFCEIELRRTRWPLGNYSLLSSVFGCPENDSYSWYKGHINLTIPTTTLKQRWKMPVDITVKTTSDPHILGPYHYWSLQLNFCTRTDDNDGNNDDNVTDRWPPGDYCLFKKWGNCPLGFYTSTTTLGGYNATWSDTDGILPEVTFSNTSREVTLMLCCRQDGNNEPLILPNDYPFIMMKVNTSECGEVLGMTVHKERFDLIDENNIFKFQGNLSIFTKDESFQRMGLCYYQHNAVRECYHAIDHGWSYSGTVNQSIYGEPCLYWATVKDIFIPHREYVGDLSNNFCRLTNPWIQADLPRCYVNRTGQTDFVLELCNIPVCDVDTSLEVIGTFKPVYSVNGVGDSIPEYAVDGNLVGILALNGHVISGDVYAWVAVFVLPINSALNPFLYTFGSNAMKAILRQPSKKIDKRALPAGGTSVTEVFKSNLFEFGTRNLGNKISLQDLLGRRNIQVSEALLVSITLVKCFNTLHSSCMVNGNLTDKRILVQEKYNKISGVVLKSYPKLSDEEKDYVEDILQYGRVIKLLLKNINK